MDEDRNKNDPIMINCCFALSQFVEQRDPNFRPEDSPAATCHGGIDVIVSGDLSKAHGNDKRLAFRLFLKCLESA